MSCAGMATTGLGYNFKDALWNPTVWAYYDYASGGGATTGTDHTFNQLFPFGHYYLGWLDLVGRQNIHDLNFHFYLYPTKWVTTWLQFHSFWLADRSDALYNAAGVPIRISPNGGAGSHVGEELDLVYELPPVHACRHPDRLFLSLGRGVPAQDLRPHRRTERRPVLLAVHVSLVSRCWGLASNKTKTPGIVRGIGDFVYERGSGGFAESAGGGAQSKARSPRGPEQGPEARARFASCRHRPVRESGPDSHRSPLLPSSPFRITRCSNW